MTSKISIVIPAYNEQGNIYSLLTQLVKLVQKKYKYEIIVVNDGSFDQTEECVEKFHQKDSCIHLISFSRNFGHQAALLAGLKASTGDCVVTMDADFEHPVEVVSQMLDAWKQGFDIVYAKRLKQSKLSFFKKVTAGCFYKIFRKLTNGLQIQIGDFRLLDRCVVNALLNIPEHGIFLRALIPWMGFKSKQIDYVQGLRNYGGKSRYTLGKMCHLAYSGIISFSVVPLHVLVMLSIVLLLASLIYFFYVLFQESVSHTDLLFSLVFFVVSMNLLGLSLVGEYVGYLLKEVQHRPNYIIRKTTLKEYTNENK